MLTGQEKQIFTKDQHHLIQFIVHEEINKFKETVILGERGICAMQHSNINLVIDNTVRKVLQEYQDGINKKLLFGFIAVVTVQVVLYLIKN